MRKLILYTVSFTMIFTGVAVASSKFIKTEQVSDEIKRQCALSNSGSMTEVNYVKEFTFSEKDRLVANTISGPIKVRGTDGSQIKIVITGTLPENTAKNMDKFVSRKDDEVVIELAPSKNTDNIFCLLGFFAKSESYGDAVSIDIEIPRQAREIMLNSVSGDISVTGVNAQKVDSNSVSGDVNMENVIADQIDLNSISGDLAMTEVLGKGIDIDSVSGDIKFKSSTTEKFVIDFESPSGDLSGADSFRGDSERKISINSVSGDMKFSR